MSFGRLYHVNKEEQCYMKDIFFGHTKNLIKKVMWWKLKDKQIKSKSIYITNCLH